MKLWCPVLLTFILYLYYTEGVKENKGLPKIGESIRNKRLVVGKYSTRTHISVTTLVTTQPLTCTRNAINTGACKKRRRRRQVVSLMTDKEVDSNDGGIYIDSSSLDEKDLKEDGDVSKKGKLGVVLWSKTTSIFTLTSTSINTANTFSVSFLCSIGGNSYPGVCG